MQELSAPRDRMGTVSPPAYRLLRPARPETPPPVLDDAQRRVVEHGGGPLLVLAGPGTGKTTTLVESVAARVAAGLPVEQVLMLTFSRRAAGEMRRPRRSSAPADDARAGRAHAALLRVRRAAHGGRAARRPDTAVARCGRAGRRDPRVAGRGRRRTVAGRVAPGRCALSASPPPFARSRHGVPGRTRPRRAVARRTRP